MLIGTKQDLPAVVTKSEAEFLAHQKGMQYFECSSKTGSGVIDAFVFLAREARQLFFFLINKVIIDAIPISY